MDIWMYLYIVIIVVFIIGIWCIWSQCKMWWNGSSKSFNDEQVTTINNISKCNVELCHILRCYALHNCISNNLAHEDLIMYDDKTNEIMVLWEKILKKEHFYKFIDLQRKRWNLHLSIVECDADSNDEEHLNKLRIVNRSITNLHEDWWGIKFDGTEYMRNLNNQDVDIEDMVNHVVTQDYQSHSESFDKVMSCQNNIDTIINKVFVYKTTTK